MERNEVRRPRKRLIVAAGVLAALFVALGLLWSQRTPIARDYVDRALAQRGVAARYRIGRFGVSSQRLENISIGDPRAPDLTADWAELEISISGGWPRLHGVVAHGVRLRGRLVDGKLSLGTIDRLLPAPSNAPFALPDLAVDLDDARMRLDTPNGAVGLALTGSGNLAGGFTGTLAATMRTIEVAGCRATAPTAFVKLAIVDRRPALDGPISASRIDCAPSGLHVGRADAALDARLSAGLDAWQGRARLTVADVARGAERVAGITGRIDFVGTRARFGGTVALAATQARLGPLARGRPALDGRWLVAGGRAGFAGWARVTGGGVSSSARQALAASQAVAAGTPVGPIWAALAPTLAAASSDIDAKAAVSVVRDTTGGAVRVATLTARSVNGASATFGGGQGAAYRWPSGAWRIDGAVALAGGGLPATRIRLAQRDPAEPLSGEATVAVIAAGGARLALAPIGFAVAGGGVRFRTVATIDGPLADGRIDGLRVPLVGWIGGGGFAIGEACVPISFARLSIAGLVVGPGRLPLCPSGGALVSGVGGSLRGGGVVAGPRLAGTIGRAPATIAAARIGFSLGTPGFTADAVAVRIGAGDTTTRLDVATLGGAASAGGVGGRFQGAGGNIGSVPLLLSQGSGGWRLAGGVLTLAGRLRVADRAAAPRFNPLVCDDVRLRLVGGRIDAAGRLAEPRSGTAVAGVTLAHDLGSGIGHAVLDVPGLAFGDKFQPDALTPLTLGVVANVRGAIAGRGDIRWTAAGATSDGTFRTEGLALAAAFGPVTGLSGEIRFSDLLALATPPGQVASLAEVNPGVSVTGGVVRYQLLPGQLVKVEGGHWPFSGGELLLDPTLLDFGRPSDRRFTFRIVGMDSAQFVQQFELKNIALTGTFDGVLPMLFDSRGGRIVGGRLAVRKGGGTLAYVGEVSNADLGMFAKLAFDALKSMRYDALAIDLDGALDGELISRVLFNGTNETPKANAKGLLAQFTGLPFRFNITIHAPFRGLLNSAQSFNDPRSLIGQSLPAPPAPAAPVQPKESETVP